MIFMQDSVFIVLLVTLFTICGWSVVAPFGNRIAFPAASSAFAGLMMLSCAALAVHVILPMTYWKAVIIAGCVLGAASLITFYVFGYRDLLKGLPSVAVVAVILVVCATLTVTSTDLFFQGPGFFYKYGGDHLGYALMADWLRSHVANTPLTLAQDDVYDSYPDFLLTRDPRFGSFSLLALISVISGRSGAFAYDLTCAVVLVVTAMGVSSVFGRTRSVFVLLVASLFVSVWFDYGRAGYLGKIVGSPAAIFVVGLVFEFYRLVSTEEEFPLYALGAIALIVICAVIMYNAQLIAVVLAVFGSLFLLARQYRKSQDSFPEEAVRSGLILAALIVLAIASGGTIARPLYFYFLPMSVGWKALADWAIQLVGPIGMTGPRSFIDPARIILLTIFGSITTYAIFTKSATAASLTIGTLLIAGGLYVFDQQWRFFEISPLFVAMTVCAGAAIVSRESLLGRRRRFVGLLVVFLLIPIGISLPRYAATLRYVGGNLSDPRHRFSLEETDRLAAAVANGATIDAGEGLHFNLFLIAELGRRGIPFQLSETSWRVCLSYRPWPFPRYENPMPMSIVLRSEANSGSPLLLARTTQFDVVRRP
jgi:hypothetical protein